MSYYPDAADQYFPHGTIDLRTAIAIAVESGNEADGGRCFTITTAQKTHRFQAESPESAKEWTKQLRKVMFRLHNDGDAVKISLPIANVEDIEDNPVVDFADTFRIRVIDNDETYAIDEVAQVIIFVDAANFFLVLLFLLCLWPECIGFAAEGSAAKSPAETSHGKRAGIAKTTRSTIRSISCRRVGVDPWGCPDN